jgi:single-strand DNA-binding protein
VRNSVPITVNGNLTDAPELRFTPSGVAVCRFTVAVNPRYYDKTAAEWKDGEPSFYRCQAWRQLAENVAETLAKGHRVIVVGEQQQRSWPDKDDPSKTHYAWEVTADAVGPDLSWATATVKKMARSGRDEVPPDDPWATGSRTPVAAGSAGSAFDVEPGF